MQIMYSKVLALCVFHQWVTAAFLVPIRNARPSVVLHADGSSGDDVRPFSDRVDVFSHRMNVFNSPRAAPLTRYNRQQHGERYNRQQHGAVRADPLSTIGTMSDPRRHVSPISPHGGTVQGGSRRSWSSANGRSEMFLETDGRPLSADVELWQGPNNTPQRVRVYSEDGRLRPFQAAMETPYGMMGHSVDVRNTGPLEFPLAAGVTGGAVGTMVRPPSRLETVQGGSLRSFRVDPYVETVQLTLTTDGLPLMATVELLQGPNTVKQVAEVYNDGMGGPFSCIIETPGYGSTIEIRNEGPIEYPIRASVDPVR